ncbi:hypothetical protein KOR42_04960 [Thalassoglobus neptunius]|uniref:Uncharacterized protein n=1 Tax=Thalassoglobus neptunius TaxID=1938619 RepID=A0A5C5X2X5_9PLAN|nr:hypothetical protein KOR42_04960 [Thalassoglobus neptunius]
MDCGENSVRSLRKNGNLRVETMWRSSILGSANGDSQLQPLDRMCLESRLRQLAVAMAFHA